MPPVRLIETVRVLGERAPLWDRHVGRLRRSADALGVPLGPLDPPAGRDRIVRIVTGGGGIVIDDRPPPPRSSLSVAFSGISHPGYRHKTDRRESFDAARAEARLDRAEEALLSTAAGWVAEGSFTTLFWWEGDRLAAPPLELGILPSIARARIGELAGEIVEVRVEPSRLRGRSIFLANAARGIMEISALQGEKVPRDERTEALAGRFWP